MEFAIVASAFFVMMLGIIEYGMYEFTKSQVEAITFQATREVGIGAVKPGCADRASCIIKLVGEKSKSLMHPESVKVTSTVVTNAGTRAPEVPDICLDNASSPYPATCGKWVENNSTAGYQAGGALSATSIGVAGDIVEIRVTYLWHVLFPFFRSRIGKEGLLTITSTTVVKNEPF